MDYEMNLVAKISDAISRRMLDNVNTIKQANYEYPIVITIDMQKRYPEIDVQITLTI